MIKRGRPKTTGKGLLVGIRLQKPLLSALDAWIADQDPRPTRPEAIRFAFREWLIGRGLLPLDAGDERE
jgi:hypothetical protein